MKKSALCIAVVALLFSCLSSCVRKPADPEEEKEPETEQEDSDLADDTEYMTDPDLGYKVPVTVIK